MPVTINERVARPLPTKYSVRPLIGAMGLTGTPEAQAAMNVLAKYGTDAHLYIPGIGNPYGVTTGNYQLSTGTDAANDQPVGLSLDAAGSVGPVLFEANNVTAGTTAAGAAISGLASTIAITSGKTYVVSYQITSLIGQLSSSIAATVYGPAGSVNQTGSFTDYLVATATGSYSFGLYARGSGVTSVTGSVSVREVTGIHASQTTSGFRPVLRRVPVLGPELVTNGGFDSGTGWSLGAGWAIGSGVATKTAGTGSLLTNTNGTSTQAGKTYIVSCTISNCTAGSIQFDMNGLTSPLSTNGSNGYYSQIVGPTTATTVPKIWATTSFDGSVDNISVKEVLGYRDVWYWQFDGTDDRLSLGSVPFQMSDDHCVVAGARNDSLAAARTIYSNSNVSNHQAPYINFDSSGNINAAWYDGTTSRVATSPGYVAGTNVVVSARRSGVSAVARKNGVQIGATLDLTAMTNPSLSTATVGGFNGGVFVFNGNIYAVIAIKGTVSDADLKTLERWVGQLSGVTIA